MPTDVKIVDTRRLPSPDPERVGKLDVMVVYQLPDKTNRVLRLPAEDLTDEKLKTAIAADVKELAALKGKTIQID
jgi:hypothetical protein